MNPVVHFEMPAKDRKRMADFYTKVFGWRTQLLGPEMGNRAASMVAFFRRRMTNQINILLS